MCLCGAMQHGSSLQVTHRGSLNPPQKNQAHRYGDDAGENLAANWFFPLRYNQNEVMRRAFYAILASIFLMISVAPALAAQSQQPAPSTKPDDIPVTDG